MRQAGRPREMLRGLAGKGSVWMLAALLVGPLCGLARGGEEAKFSLKPTDLLPGEQELKGWQSPGPPAVYTGDELFDYINGGAELYLEFHFQRVGVQEYRNDAGSSLVVEVYEMDSPENAYGLYSYDTRGDHPAIGQEATYSLGLLKFWKDRFLCRILSLETDEKMKGVLFSLGETIAARISSEGSKSAILAHVPEEKVVPESVHYFHQRVTLNNFYYLSDENLLNLDRQTEGVFFEYELPGKAAKVILLRYLRPQDAIAAFEKVREGYFRESGAGSSGAPDGRSVVKSVKPGEYAGMTCLQNYLILVLGAQEQGSCQDLMDSMGKRVAKVLE